VSELDRDLTGFGPLTGILSKPVRSILADLLIVAALMVVATAVRLPYLQQVPLISDEAVEVLAAQGMVGGQLIWFRPF